MNGARARYAGQLRRPPMKHSSLAILASLVFSACRSTDPAYDATPSGSISPRPEIRYYEIADT